MTPYQRLVAGTHHFKNALNEELNEMLAFAELMSRQRNMITFDSDGQWYSIASGELDEIIDVLEQQLGKLKRIREEKNIDRKPL